MRTNTSKPIGYEQFGQLSSNNVSDCLQKIHTMIDQVIPQYEKIYH